MRNIIALAAFAFLLSGYSECTAMQAEGSTAAVAVDKAACAESLDHTAERLRELVEAAATTDDTILWSTEAEMLEALQSVPVDMLTSLSDDTSHARRARRLRDTIETLIGRLEFRQLNGKDGIDREGIAGSAAYATFVRRSIEEKPQFLKTLKTLVTDMKKYAGILRKDNDDMTQAKEKNSFAAIKNSRPRNT